MKRSLKNPVICGIFVTGAIIATCLSFTKKQDLAVKSVATSSAPVPQAHVSSGEPSIFPPVFSAGDSSSSDRFSHFPSQPSAETGVVLEARQSSQEAEALTPLLQSNSGRSTRQNRHISRTQEPGSSAQQSPTSSDEMPATESEIHVSDVLLPAIAPGQPVVEEALPPLSLAVPDRVFDILTKKEQEMILSEGEKFVESIQKSPDADPESPAYFDHWKSARRLHDEHLRITLGWDRFNQLSAAAAAAAETTKADSRM